MDYLRKYILGLIVVIFLVSCGGGGGGSSSQSSTTLSATVADGYIKSANVCLDTNINGICDTSERATTTNSLGHLSFSNVTKTLVALIASNGVDIATDKEFLGTLKKILKVDLSKGTNSFNITPLSDIVAAYFLNSAEKTPDKLDEIRKSIATSLGILVDELIQDPMKNHNIFIKSQEIEQIKMLIKETGANSSNIALALSQEIIDTKSSDINISSIYDRISYNIATDKINYIQTYINNLKREMNNNISSDDTTLLNKYQMLIDNTTYQVSQKIANNDLSSQVTIDLSNSRVSSSTPIVANPIPDIGINENSTTQTIDLSNVFTDVDDDDNNITKIVLSNTNEALVSTSLIGDSLILTFHPNQGKMATITIRATSNGLSVNDSFVVKVSNDIDNDFIPDNIEEYLGMDKADSDQDGDGVVDGLESSTSSISDQFFDKQWYIYNLDRGNDLNLLDIYHNYMGYNNGDPLVVQVVDSGVDADHEDLIQNMDLSLSRDSRTGTMGDPVETETHGTMCAGIIGARAFNGKGIRGIAPFVKIAGSNWLSYQSNSELEEVWTKNDPNAKIVLANNSWGVDGAYADTYYEDLMEYGANNLRKVDGIARGKLFIKAAGNDREIRHDSGLSYISSNPYVITVAALGKNNTYAYYSSPGSNILVSGYGGDGYTSSDAIATTTAEGNTSMPTWDEDTNHNYTYAFNGTSAATPTVAGSLALVLEACPKLSWRDVKYLIAKNAIKVDPTNSNWQTNSAGLHHSVDYGFGLINPKGMIDECKNGYTPLPSSTTFEEHFDPEPDIDIPDNSLVGISYTFTVSTNKIIEWLGVTIYSDHNWAGDLEIYLTSPHGTKTRLMLGENSGENYSLSAGFRYGSVAFMGESSVGDWTLDIIDKSADDSGALQKVDFKVFGH